MSWISKERLADIAARTHDDDWEFPPEPTRGSAPQKKEFTMKKFNARKANIIFWIGMVAIWGIGLALMIRFNFLYDIAWQIVATIAWAIFVERKLTEKPGSIQSLFG